MRIKTNERPTLLRLNSLKFIPLSQDNSVSKKNRKLLGRRVCGPACVAMVLKFFDKYPTDKDFGNIEWLVAKITSLHHNGKPSIKQKIRLDGRDEWITIGTTDEIRKTERNQKVFEADELYEPAFSLIRGYDHRVSKTLFGLFGLHAGGFESVSIKEIKTMLRRKKILILSIKPRRKIAENLPGEEAFEGHLVTVSDYEPETDRFFIVDPDFDLKKGLLPKYEIRAGDLVKISNNRGTWVEENKRL